MSDSIKENDMMLWKLMVVLIIETYLKRILYTIPPQQILFHRLLPLSTSSQDITQETKPVSDSKFFAIRTTGGQEHMVANILQNKINAKKIGIRSILGLDSFKGYIIVEAPDSNVAYEALAGIRHARGQIRGELPFKDIEGYLVKKPVMSDLNVDDTVGSHSWSV